LGVGLEWLSGDAMNAREPHLSPRVVAALYSPHDHQVDNRAVATALIAAFQRAGGRLHETAAVTRIEISANRIVGLQIGERDHAADIVVLAAGAWSRDIAGMPNAARPPVRPVKGQMIALRMDPQVPLLNQVLWTPKAYLVPRRSGRLLVGASVEERGFDAALTAGAVMALLEAAWRAIPATEDLAIDEAWAGFRPGSPDDAPILGPSGVDGLILATGHYRNGILLTPVTASLISTFILTGARDPLLRTFSPARFARVEESS
jgi:glycine oxidase